MKALLVDIGGTLVDDDAAAGALMTVQKQLLRESGYAVTDEEFTALVEQVRGTFVPGLHRAVVWRFTRPDVARCNALVAQAREHIPEIRKRHPARLYSGVESVLAILSDRCALALAANAQSTAREALAHFGILRYF